MLDKIPENYKNSKELLTTIKENLESAKQNVDNPFPQREELSEKSKKLKRLDGELRAETLERKERKSNVSRDSDGKPSVLGTINNSQLRSITIDFGNPDATKSKSEPTL